MNDTRTREREEAATRGSSRGEGEGEGRGGSSGGEGGTGRGEGRSGRGEGGSGNGRGGSGDRDGDRVRDRDRDETRQSALYIYGVLPADVEIDPKATGVGEPPTPIALLTHGGIAALVGEISPGVRLGAPQDFAAHARILDEAAAEVPVLPLRFGAVMTDRDAVIEEFLAPYEQHFSETLRSLEGRRQLVVKGRYVEQALLREILDEVPKARQLQQRIAKTNEATSREERIALGELIGKSVEARRAADTRRLAGRLGEAGIEFKFREPTHEFDAVHLACLVERADEKRLREECTRFARDQEGRIELRLLGPMAAYDFVDVGPPEG